MEHAIITPLANGYFRIVPDEGYILYDAASDKYYVEAVTKKINKFKVVIDSLGFEAVEE